MQASNFASAAATARLKVLSHPGFIQIIRFPFISTRVDYDVPVKFKVYVQLMHIVYDSYHAYCPHHHRCSTVLYCIVASEASLLVSGRA